MCCMITVGSLALFPGMHESLGMRLCTSTSNSARYLLTLTLYMGVKGLINWLLAVCIGRDENAL